LLLVLVSCSEKPQAERKDSPLPEETAPASATFSNEDLQSFVAGYRAESGLVGLAAAVVDGEKVLLAADGLRRRGGSESLTTSDKFHLGSNSKAMTATLAALMVQEGQVTWAETLPALFPKIEIAEGYLDVTLVHLLTHRAGLTGNLLASDSDLWLGFKVSDTSVKPESARRRLAAELLKKPPHSPVGTYLYSNVGFALAGAALEVRTGQTYEELLRQKVFEPLGMQHCGFGAPTGEQPWGHHIDEPVDPHIPGADNPRVISPAGAVHCTMRDWVAFARLHFVGRKESDALLKPSTREVLHKARADDYAMGWIRTDVGSRYLLGHSGSNTMSYSVIKLSPLWHRAILIATNDSIGRAEVPMELLVSALERRYFNKPPVNRQ
jgi:CubicO group peptidase (beta-lactamase class C family)